MKTMESVEITINCTEIDFSIKGIAETYGEQVWTEDDEHEDGGYFDYVIQKYVYPKVDMAFTCKIDSEVVSGDIYIDLVSKNNFLVISPNTITLINQHVDTFSIPKVLALIYSNCRV